MEHSASKMTCSRGIICIRLGMCALVCASLSVAAAEQEPPQIIDPEDVICYAAYHLGEPITNWPLKRLEDRFTELRGVKAAPDQHDLPEILRRASESVKEYLRDFTNTTSVETIDQSSRIPMMGRVRQQEFRQQFRYLMILSGDSVIGDYAIKEDRTDPHPSGPRYDKRSSQFFRTSGFASLPVCLSLEEQARTDFRYLGEHKVPRKFDSGSGFRTTHRSRSRSRSHQSGRMVCADAASRNLLD
jgi:hypothetical protein